MVFLHSLPPPDFESLGSLLHTLATDSQSSSTLIAFQIACDLATSAPQSLTERVRSKMLAIQEKISAPARELEMRKREKMVCSLFRALLWDCLSLDQIFSKSPPGSEGLHFCVVATGPMQPDFDEEGVEIAESKPASSASSSEPSSGSVQVDQISKILNGMCQI